MRAMQNKPSGGYRVPTNIWSGYGISHTSPGGLGNEKPKENVDSEIWKTPTSKMGAPFGYSAGSSAVNLNASNFMDHTPTKTLNRITGCKWPDLATLLTSLGLEKYINVFVTHEIDLTTFPSLTDRDLVEIGVTALGARRKLLLVISELTKRSSPFSGSAAPGAERKNSTSTLTNSPLDGW